MLQATGPSEPTSDEPSPQAHWEFADTREVSSIQQIWTARFHKDTTSNRSLEVRTWSVLATVMGHVGDVQGLGGGGGAKGAEAPPPPPPLQVNEMRNIHFGQNTNSHLSETPEK